VDWRNHISLALSIVAACAFLAVITAIIISLNSIPDAVLG
jgi:hypothetical protein